ncbi:MAG: hypothetical protein AAGM38_10615, partial [Pseudomonadota bacterium]
TAAGALAAALSVAAAAPAFADDPILFERSETGAWISATPFVAAAPWNFSLNELGAKGAAGWPDETPDQLGALGAMAWPTSPQPRADDDIAAEDRKVVFERMASGAWAPERQIPAQRMWNEAFTDLGALGAARWPTGLEFAAKESAAIETASIRARAGASAYDASWGDMFRARGTLTAPGRAAFASAFDAFWETPTVEPLTPSTAYVASFGRRGATPATAYAPFEPRAGYGASAPSAIGGGATPATAYAPALAPTSPAPIAELAGPPAPAAILRDQSPDSVLSDFTFGGLHLGSIFRGGWLSRSASEEIEPAGAPAWEEIWREETKDIGTATIPYRPFTDPQPPQTPRESDWGLD